MQQTFDIVIIGGGMIGLALACGLSQQRTGLRIAVVEQQIPNIICCKNKPILRFSAINAASKQLLKYLNVWDSMTDQINPYYAIEVWERDSFGYINFNGTELGYPELGYIIENTVIQQALRQRVCELEKITLITPSSPHQIWWGDNEVFISLTDNQILVAKLLVAADGTHSWLREQANIPLIYWDYQHHALIATIRTAQPHCNITRQTFHGDGILAFLPLKDPYLSFIVWSLPSLLAREYLEISEKKFNIELTKNFSLNLGLCTLQGERYTFPLKGCYAHNFIKSRIVLVGDAAHTLHPLAGQGANLGFMDVALLLGEIQNLRKSGKDIGHYRYLQEYERNRKHSAALMIVSIQILFKIFARKKLLKKLIRGAGLRMLNIAPYIKKCFIQQALGINDLPDWLVDLSFD